MNDRAAKLSTCRLVLPATKIGSRHLDRLAMVYVRQSTVQQTLRHQESTRMQYGLVDRAVSLGWSRERIVVVDDDLGRSGASADGRPGFQRLVAEVGLDHVGIILGVEMSRLARSCRDWHQLLEVCAIFGTLISDLDGIYDPSHYNDRLLLGLKGTMSEAELHVLKQRMNQGKVMKAQRGELSMLLPFGYVRRPSGEVVRDPDEQVQSIIRMIFDQFDTRGTVHGILTYMVENGIKLPVRSRSGESKGDLEWHRPNRVTLNNLLHNPTYAGAYVYGRRPIDPRRKEPGRPGTGRTSARVGDWQVVIKDRIPAYITWQRYEDNLAQLAANRTLALGTPRRGPALLGGLLECGRCGRRMCVTYGGRRLGYICSRDTSDYGGPACQSMSGRVLDERITQLVLEALEPSALEVSLKVAEDLEAERRRLEENWCKRLERADYEVQRARRQYNAVEPENRLVARTLERQLEEKLRAQQSLQEEHDRFTHERPSILTGEERDQVRALAEDIPALWSAPTTTAIDRQTIIRQLIDRVVVTVEGRSEKVSAEIHWAGGHETRTTVIRPVARLDQLSYLPGLLDEVERLKVKNLTSDEIAQRLNEAGWRPAKRRETFNGPMVRQLLSRRRIVKKRNRPSRDSMRTGEWRLPDLAAELGMPTISLYAWLKRGWVHGRQLDEPGRPWALFADDMELARLRALRAAPKIGWRAKTEKLLARA